ncbi:MAG: hypothetical protein JJT76_16010 [Clostridiaceae bacterium]|nr:hypothetical protein [Clostridiaceae bacterium]
MKRSLLVGGILVLIMIFVILGFSQSIKQVIDPRYILLVLLTILGSIIFIFSYLDFKSYSIGENLADIVISILTGTFGITNVFGLLLGLFFVIIGVLGFVHGPDWLGMKGF